MWLLPCPEPTLRPHSHFLQDNGGPAREVLQAVASECRTRIEMYAIALQRWAEAELSGAAAAEQTGEAGQLEQQRRRRRRQQEQQQEQSAGAAPPRPPPPPRPFTISQAALLLTGLAKARLRVGGLVEPMLLQCESEIGQAAASDVARILIALGELHMEVGECNRLPSATTVGRAVLSCRFASGGQPWRSYINARSAVGQCHEGVCAWAKHDLFAGQPACQRTSPPTTCPPTTRRRRAAAGSAQPAGIHPWRPVPSRDGRRGLDAHSLQRPTIRPQAAAGAGHPTHQQQAGRVQHSRHDLRAVGAGPLQAHAAGWVGRR